MSINHKETKAGSHLEALVAFARGNNLPHFPPDLCERLLTHLTTPEEWMDIHRHEKQHALGIIVQSCESADNSASLDILAIQGTLTDQEKDSILTRGIAIAKAGPRSVLNFALWKGLWDWQANIERLGFNYAYSAFEMIQKRTMRPWLPVPAPIPSIKWVMANAHNVEGYFNVLKRSFSDIPGTFIPDLGEMRRCIASGKRPIWLLEEAGKVIGFLLVRLHKETGVGELASLGRDPAKRGQGLGPHIMLKAQTLLNEQGAESYNLHVVGSNRKALELYERCGFEVAGEERVFTLPVA